MWRQQWRVFSRKRAAGTHPWLEQSMLSAAWGTAYVWLKAALLARLRADASGGNHYGCHPLPEAAAVGTGSRCAVLDCTDGLH